MARVRRPSAAAATAEDRRGHAAPPSSQEKPTRNVIPAWSSKASSSQSEGVAARSHLRCGSARAEGCEEDDGEEGESRGGARIWQPGRRYRWRRAGSGWCCARCWRSARGSRGSNPGRPRRKRDGRAPSHRVRSCRPAIPWSPRMFFDFYRFFRQFFQIRELSPPRPNQFGVQYRPAACTVVRNRWRRSATLTGQVLNELSCQCTSACHVACIYRQCIYRPCALQ
jgi:hypothetical protein